MPEKLHIIEQLGEPGLLLPTLVNAGLAANDRVKYRFTVLQAAAGHARHPGDAVPDLRSERFAAGVADEALDAAVGQAIAPRPGAVQFPGAGRLIDESFADVTTMIAPLAQRGDGEFAQRLARIREITPAITDDTVSEDVIAGLTRGTRERGDTLHLLVMDAHKALNAVQATIATANIDGASTYGLAAEDADYVQAFMRGIAKTAPLKFDHPGLGTTVTRVGARLVLQNDIGTTDAHVLVVHVESSSVTLIYTDVHLQRLMFFQNLFRSWTVDWEDTRSRRDDHLDDGVYHVCVGTYVAPKHDALLEYLTFLGSRITFLIDWNKARKRLRALVSKDASIKLLEWAADHDRGHMAFLKAGGEQLVFDALDFVVKGQARFGERLDTFLGAAEAFDYLCFVLKACAESLLGREPESFIQDTVRAELLRYFRTSHQLTFDLAAEHAALVSEIAAGIRDTLLRVREGNATEQISENAARAKDWESRADALVNRMRSALAHPGSSDAFLAIIEAADDVADALEEAAFHLTLVAAEALPGVVSAGLQSLCELLVQASQEYVKLVETARHVRRGGAREDMHDFLEATHRIVALERRTDEAHRRVTAELVTTATDFRLLHTLTETAKDLEQAADCFMHAALRMRDYVIEQAATA